MNAEAGSSEDKAVEVAPVAPAPPTGPPVNFSATTAPTPPPPDPKLNPAAHERRKPVRTVAGVVLAVLLIGAKLFLAAGAGHWLAGGSAPVIVVVVIALIILGFVSRFLRM